MKQRSPAIAIVVSATLMATACSRDEPTLAPTTAPSEPVVLPSPWDIDAALAADPDCAEPIDGDGLVIGYAADLAGPGSAFDLPGSAAAEHFVRQINCSGGVVGSPVSLVVEEISGDPASASRTAQALIDAGADAIIGPPSSDLGAPLLDVTAGQVPVIFAGATDPGLADASDLSFLVGIDDIFEASAAAEFALQQGWRTAVTISIAGDSFGFDPDAFTAVFEAGGGSVVARHDDISIDGEDFGGLVAEMSADETPDIVFGALASDRLVALVSQMEAAGVETTYLDTHVFETTGGLALDDLDGVFYLAHAFGFDNERYKKLEASFEASTGAPSTDPTAAALVVDSIAVIIDAHLRAGSAGPDALGSAIPDSMDVQAVTDLLSYEGAAGPSKTAFVIEIVDGEPVLAGRIS